MSTTKDISKMNRYQMQELINKLTLKIETSEKEKEDLMQKHSKQEAEM